MRTKFKTLTEEPEYNSLKNRNFLNNQNYVLSANKINKSLSFAFMRLNNNSMYIKDYYTNKNLDNFLSKGQLGYINDKGIVSPKESYFYLLLVNILMVLIPLYFIYIKHGNSSDYLFILFIFIFLSLSFIPFNSKKYKTVDFIVYILDPKIKKIFIYRM